MPCRVRRGFHSTARAPRSRPPNALLIPPLHAVRTHARGLWVGGAAHSLVSSACLHSPPGFSQRHLYPHSTTHRRQPWQAIPWRALPTLTRTRHHVRGGTYRGLGRLGAAAEARGMACHVCSNTTMGLASQFFLEVLRRPLRSFEVPLQTHPFRRKAAPTNQHSSYLDSVSTSPRGGALIRHPSGSGELLSTCRNRMPLVRLLMYPRHFSDPAVVTVCAIRPRGAFASL